MGSREGFVLVAEDEMLVRFDLVDALEEAGFAVLDAATADEALLILTAGRHVIALVTDVQMPGCLDGLGLAAIASMQDAERPVVICTGAPLSTLSTPPPGTLVFQKPCAAEAIAAAVSSALSARGVGPQDAI